MRGNKKGPENMGPKTGRGHGFCTGSDSPGYESNEPPQGMRRGHGPGNGRGFTCGMGRGNGRGFGWGPARGNGQGYFADNSEILARLDKIEEHLNKEDKK